MVIPFENGSSLKSLDWMASACAVTIAEKLEALPALRPVYGPGIVDGLSSTFAPEKLVARARELGAKWVVGGAFSRPNWKPELTVRIYRVVDASETMPTPTLRLAAEASGVGEREKLFELIDKQLLSALKNAGIAVGPRCRRR